MRRWAALLVVALVALHATSKQPLPYPDLFIIGAQKCGTTTLNLLLQQHPSFCDQGQKEKHFFSDDKAYVTNYDAHVGKFLGEFKKCNRSLLTIDATPSYVWLDYVPGFVKESYTKTDLKAKKFVLLLREPVLRCEGLGFLPVMPCATSRALRASDRRRIYVHVRILAYSRVLKSAPPPPPSHLFPRRRYSEYQRELRLCLRIFDESGYDFSQLYDYGRSNKYSVETMVEHSKKYCSRIMKNSAAEAMSGGGKGHKKEAVNLADAEFMTFAGWQESASGVNELSRGYYLEQMKRWLKVIDRSQLMVLAFTDLITRTTATVEALAGLSTSITVLTSLHRTLPAHVRPLGLGRLFGRGSGPLVLGRQPHHRPSPAGRVQPLHRHRHVGACAP